MNVIPMTGTTSSEGALTLTLPLGWPNTRFEVAIIAQPQPGSGPPAPKPAADCWAAINAFRERLAASGRKFGDSTQDIREDRDR